MGVALNLNRAVPSLSGKSTINSMNTVFGSDSNCNSSSGISTEMNARRSRDGLQSVHHENEDLVPLQIEDVYRRQLEAAQQVRTTNGRQQKIQSQHHGHHLVEVKEDEEFQEGLKALHSPRPFEDEIRKIGVLDVDDALAMSLPRSPLCDQVSMGQMEG